MAEGQMSAAIALESAANALYAKSVDSIGMAPPVIPWVWAALGEAGAVDADGVV
jgi:hypothetical protein